MPCTKDVTAINVLVARMIPSSVRKLRNLLLRRESTAIPADSQKEAVGDVIRRTGRALHRNGTRASVKFQDNSDELVSDELIPAELTVPVIRLYC